MQSYTIFIVNLSKDKEGHKFCLNNTFVNKNILRNLAKKTYIKIQENCNALDRNKAASTLINQTFHRAIHDLSKLHCLLRVLTSAMK